MRLSIYDAYVYIIFIYIYIYIIYQVIILCTCELGPCPGIRVPPLEQHRGWAQGKGSTHTHTHIQTARQSPLADTCTMPIYIYIHIYMTEKLFFFKKIYIYIYIYMPRGTTACGILQNSENVRPASVMRPTNADAWLSGSGYDPITPISCSIRSCKPNWEVLIIHAPKDLHTWTPGSYIYLSISIYAMPQELYKLDMPNSVYIRKQCACLNKN